MKPILTLFTHDQCLLCLELVDELESKFGGRFILEKIDITHKTNVKFLKLYRNDIPVLFLNGQFLCMHRLNSDVLHARLKSLEEI